MKSWLQYNNIETYSMHKEWKSVVAEKLYDFRSKHVNIDNLYDIVIKYINAC